MTPAELKRGGGEEGQGEEGEQRVEAQRML